MKGLTYSSDQEFYINGVNLSGINSINGGYSLPTEKNNFLGYSGPVDLVQSGPGRASFSVSKSMITTDREITDLIGNVSFNGGLKYNGRKLGFNSGCITSYSASFEVDKLPSSQFSISVYGNMGGGVSPQTGAGLTGDAFSVGYDQSTLTVALEPTINLNIGDTVYLEGANFDYSSCSDPQINWNNQYYKINNVTGNEYGLATQIEFLHGKTTNGNCGGEYADGGIVSRITSGSFTPSNSGIVLECDGSSTNRVTSFSYQVEVAKNPIYKIGSYEPCQIMSKKPIKNSLSFRLEVDDYQSMQVYNSIKHGIHDRTLHISAMDICDPSNFVKYTISGAHLVSESLSTNSNNETSVNLQYESYTNEVPKIEYDAISISAGEIYYLSCGNPGLTFKFDGEDGEEAVVIIDSEGHVALPDVIIKNVGGDFVWDYGGAQQHTFTYTGEVHSVSYGECGFHLVFEGYGSLVLTVRGSEGLMGYTHSYSLAWPEIYKVTSDPCQRPATVDMTYSFMRAGTLVGKPADEGGVLGKTLHYTTGNPNMETYDTTYDLVLKETEYFVDMSNTEVQEAFASAFGEWKEAFEFLYPWLTLNFVNLGNETSNQPMYRNSKMKYTFELPSTPEQIAESGRIGDIRLGTHGFGGTELAHAMGRIIVEPAEQVYFNNYYRWRIDAEDDITEVFQGHDALNTLVEDHGRLGVSSSPWANGVCINRDKEFRAEETPYSSLTRKHELKSVCVHELGHVFNIGHAFYEGIETPPVDIENPEWIHRDEYRSIMKGTSVPFESWETSWGSLTGKPVRPNPPYGDDILDEQTYGDTDLIIRPSYEIEWALTAMRHIYGPTGVPNALAASLETELITPQWPCDTPTPTPTPITLTPCPEGAERECYNSLDCECIYPTPTATSTPTVFPAPAPPTLTPTRHEHEGHPEHHHHPPYTPHPPIPTPTRHQHDGHPMHHHHQNTPH